MGLFDKNKGQVKNEIDYQPAVTMTPKSDQKGDNMGTIIGPGLEIVGHLNAEENVYIAGKIKGEVSCRRMVTVAAGGHVEGKVICQSVTVFGSIHGDVEASDHINIEKSGKLIGDIRTKIFTNQPGGFFEGYSHMVNQPKEQAKKPVEAAEKQTETKRKGS